jgi:hypothetical protein
MSIRFCLSTFLGAFFCWGEIVQEIYVSRTGDPVHAGDKALTRENSDLALNKICFWHFIMMSQSTKRRWNSGPSTPSSTSSFFLYFFCMSFLFQEHSNPWGEPLPKFFCRRGLQWRRLHLLIFFTEVIKFYWLMLLYPGELYRLLGASVNFQWQFNHR